MSEELARITVPWDVAKTADNRTRRGGHWSQRHRVMKQARELARWCWLQADSPKAAGKVRVSLIVRRGRVMDTCNIVGGAKPLLDGLFTNAIVPDDSPKWLELGSVRQESGAVWKGKECVVFVVESLP